MHVEVSVQADKAPRIARIGSEDAAGDLREQEKKYGRYELSISDIIQPQMDDNPAASPPPVFGEFM